MKSVTYNLSKENSKIINDFYFEAVAFCTIMTANNLSLPRNRHFNFWENLLKIYDERAKYFENNEIFI